jgi:hypothetical protein
VLVTAAKINTATARPLQLPPKMPCLYLRYFPVSLWHVYCRHSAQHSSPAPMHGRALLTLCFETQHEAAGFMTKSSSGSNVGALANVSAHIFHTLNTAYPGSINWCGWCVSHAATVKIF